MEKELLNTFDKKLLLKDLCARLPYGVKCQLDYNNEDVADLGIERYQIDRIVSVCIETEEIGLYAESAYVYPNDIRPYLFPLSSVTEEQKMFLKQQNWCITISTSGTVETTIKGIDWLNKNHFDYRGLIEKGLAIDATGLNIY